MKTRLMIVSESMPLAGASVEIEGIEGAMTSDRDGVVEVDLGADTGSFQVIVQHGDRKPASARVTHHGEHSLMVVDVNRGASGSTGEYVSSLHRSAEELNSRYSLGEVAGRGGMSIVIKAHDRLLNRTVALKLLHEEFGDNDEAQHLFLNEAQALATLSHPNLVGVHDIIKIDGRAIMVLEFIEGVHLEQIATKREGGIPQSLMLRLGIQLCRAVAYLHTQGFIHRDIKPANLIVKRDGTLKVIDFGLARSLQQLYVRGTRVRGTPAYMSPEQILGKELGPGSDVYQIGVTLYELLVGDLPFDGEMSYAHVHTPPRAISERLDSDLMPEFEASIMRSLAKDPEDRQANAAVMMRELQECYEQLVMRELDESNDTILTELGFDPDAWTQRETGGVTGQFDTLRATNSSLSTQHDLAGAPGAHANTEGEGRRTLAPLAVAALLLGIGAIAAYFAFGQPAGEPAAEPAAPSSVAAAAVPSAEPAPSPQENPAVPQPIEREVPPAPSARADDAKAEAEAPPEPAPAPAAKPKPKPKRVVRRAPVRRPKPAPAPEPEPEPVAVVAEPVAEPEPKPLIETKGSGTLDGTSDAPSLFAPKSKSRESTRNGQGLLP